MSRYHALIILHEMLDVGPSNGYETRQNWSGGANFSRWEKKYGLLTRQEIDFCGADGFSRPGTCS